MHKLLNKFSYLENMYYGQNQWLFIPLLVSATFGINIYYRHKYIIERKELRRELLGSSNFFVSSSPSQRFFLSLVTALIALVILWPLIRLFPKLLMLIMIPTSIYEVIYYIKLTIQVTINILFLSSKWIFVIILAILFFIIFIVFIMDFMHMSTHWWLY